MAKQPEDTVTAELPLAKRGRPATGHAKTAAERKRAQRERYSSMTMYPEGGWENMPTTIILEWMQRAIPVGWPEIIELGAKELSKRASANDS